MVRSASLFGLSQEIRERINAVFKEYVDIDEVILYGSRAKGNFRPGSDIDLTLKGTDLNLEYLNKVGLALDDLLLPYIFDLSIFCRISNPQLCEHIERVGRSFYVRDERT